MGRKRRHKDRNNESDRLFKKLQRELRKRRRRSYSSSSRSTEVSYESEMDKSMINDQDLDLERNSPNNITITPTLSVRDELIPQPSTSSVGIEVDDSKNEPTASASEHLDDEILMLLGDAPSEESVVGKNVHLDIATRLQHILHNGLKKEQKDIITRDYPIPGNCLLLKAPILNPEVKTAVSEALQKKDASLAARQGQHGVVLSVLSYVMDIMVTEKSDTNQILLKHVSNACRLLCDSHHIDTKLRRNFLISTLNNKLKDTLKESKQDKYLFGESLADNIKTNEAINKSSLGLKSNPVKPQHPLSNNKSGYSNNHLNWKCPQPNVQNRRVMSTVHRTAGSASTAHRNQTARKSTSRAHHSSLQYKNHRKH